MTDKITLRDLRTQSGLSVNEVCKALSIKKSTYYHYEIGVRQISLYQVLLLAQIFGMSEKEVIQAQLNSCRINRLDNRKKH